MQSIRKSMRLGGRLMKIVLSNPRRLSHVLGTALAATEEVHDASLDLLRLPGVPIEDLLPESGPELRTTLACFPKTKAGISLLEAMALVLLVKKARASTVFEFGTYKGFSVTQLALNLPPESRIFTLDLPEDDPRSAFAITDPEDIEIALEKGKGALVPKDLRNRINFLRQDSAVFDESPYEGQMDFVFVDGAHNPDYVKNDSAKGWRMLRSGGIIAWHDYRPSDPAVVRFLLQSPYNPKRIVGTTLAFATKPNGPRTEHA